MTYFAAVNTSCLIIRPDAFNHLTGSNFVCTKFECSGVDSLYRLVLDATSNDVFAYGRQVIIKLFTKVRTPMRRLSSTLFGRSESLTSNMTPIFPTSPFLFGSKLTYFPLVY